MASRAEEVSSRLLGAILADVPVGADVPESEQFRNVLAGLERFVPDVIGELHSEWRGESLDGIFPVVARKTAEAEVELYGVCVIIPDQSLTPLHLRLQLSPSRGKISWMECRQSQCDPLVGSSGSDPSDQRPTTDGRIQLCPVTSSFAVCRLVELPQALANGIGGLSEQGSQVDDDRRESTGVRQNHLETPQSQDEGVGGREFGEAAGNPLGPRTQLGLRGMRHSGVGRVVTTNFPNPHAPSSVLTLTYPLSPQGGGRCGATPSSGWWAVTHTTIRDYPSHELWLFYS